jgi:stress response protein SCP2
MGPGWHAGCDVDASCAMFNAKKRLVDAVSFKKLVSKAVKHSGDDRTGDGGEVSPLRHIMGAYFR